MLGIQNYLWRLLPANPILLRVVEGGSKRKRDLGIRCAYLGLLIVVVIFSIFTGASTQSGVSLGDLSKRSMQVFESLSYLQLGLVALLAPIFTAGAITQEKDSQTYDILLSTPLSNGQIVLGSLMSRLFFVIALLISGIPIFSVTQIFGGVAIRSIVLSFAIAAATAFVTGSLAMAIATFKVGTRRTIFSFYLFIVIYIVGGFLLDQMSYFKVPVMDATTGARELSGTSWFTGLHPFLALRAILRDKAYTPPDISSLPENLRFWPVGYFLSSPTSFYIGFMFLLSLLLVMPSVLFLRRMAQSTSTLRSWALQKMKLSTGDKTRKPRGVWNNPIAWREAKTKASAARAYLLRYGFMLLGIVGACVMLWLFSQQQPVNNWIASGSYNSGTQTIFINGVKSDTYSVIPGSTNVTLNNDHVDINVLRGHYEVVSYQQQIVKGKKVLSNIDLKEIPRLLPADMVRKYLLGAVVLEFAVILLIITNAAASTVTREKEDGSLDLLLATPITSRYYIWGKLRGLVSFVLPLVAVPVASCLIFIVFDCYRLMGASDPKFHWIVFPEAILIMPATLIIVAAFAAIVGMQLSLRCRTTVRAVMGSVGVVLGICGVLAFCGFKFLDTRPGDGDFGLIVSAFSPFTLMAIQIDPYTFAERAFVDASDGDILSHRTIMVIFSLISIGVYAAVVWTMYKSMVKNFDMTIRRQAR